MILSDLEEVYKGVETSLQRDTLTSITPLLQPKSSGLSLHPSLTTSPLFISTKFPSTMHVSGVAVFLAIVAAVAAKSCNRGGVYCGQSLLNKGMSLSCRLLKQNHLTVCDIKETTMTIL